MSLTLFCFFLLPAHPPALRSTLQGLSSFPLPKWFASTAAGSVGVNRGLSASRLGSQVPSTVSATSRDAWAGRPPLRSTARREVVRGAVGDPREWSRLTGITPQSLSAALAREPASVQERWFAALYLLKPVLFSVLFVFWILSGLLSIGPGYQIGVALMSEGGAGSLSPFAVIAGILVDLAIGIGIAIRRSAQFALYAALAISVFYVIAGTILLPRLWIDPLGPMVKIVPIMVLTLVALAIFKDR